MHPGSDVATLVIPPSLRFFLPAKRRRSEVEVSCDGCSTVGHLLAAAGVPRTEYGVLELDGRPVPPSYRPSPGDRVTVRVLTTPQPAPTDPPRFLLDVHLGTLARRMRLLGLDSAYDREAADDALVATSLAEQRVLLTRDRGLLHRRALRWAAHVNHQVPDEQLREVLDRFDPPVRPWTRCPACNGTLHDVAKGEVEDALPAGTRRCYESFRRCGHCGQVYWQGAHGDRLQRIVAAATPRGQ